MLARLNRPFAPQSKLFIPVTLGYLAGCVAIISLVAFIAWLFSGPRAGSFLSMDDLTKGAVIPLALGSPGYLLSFFVFHRARRDAWRIWTIPALGAGIGAAMGLFLTLLILSEKGGDAHWLSMLLVLTGVFALSATICMTCMLFFFAWGNKVHDNRYRDTLAVGPVSAD